MESGMSDTSGVETTGEHYELPPPHPELRRLDPLVGNWRGAGRSTDNFGPEMDIEGTERFWWLKGGYFLASEYRMSWGGSQPPDEGVMYWGYDAELGRFKTYFFNDKGPFDSELSSYEGVVEQSQLTFIGPARFCFRLDDVGQVAVDRDGRIHTEWFLRDADGEFKLWRYHDYTPLS
jgi:hypothetical protein